jgi:NADPH-ferrihemoprotein reductase
VTCAVVDEVLPGGRRHLGVCSTFLKNSKPGMRLAVFARTSTFRLPRDLRTPVVMIGPGTGLAPFLGFLQERAALVARGGSVADGHLFFGCRRPDQDYIYQVLLCVLADTPRVKLHCLQVLDCALLHCCAVLCTCSSH